MQELSYVFKDRPMSPQQSIVYWTEYVIRHNGTSYLKPFGNDMPLYKYLMLDVIAVILIVSSVTVFSFYAIGRELYIVTKKSKYGISTKKKN